MLGKEVEAAEAFEHTLAINPGGHALSCFVNRACTERQVRRTHTRTPTALLHVHETHTRIARLSPAAPPSVSLLLASRSPPLASFPFCCFVPGLVPHLLLVTDDLRVPVANDDAIVGFVAVVMPAINYVVLTTAHRIAC